MEPAIRVEGLVRRFGAAVDGLSFEVAAGEVLGLLGHNGAGKTTTVRVLNGVLSRHAGRVSVLGLDPDADGDALRARTGVLTEQPAVDDRFTARENLAFFARLHRLEAAQAAARVDALLRAFDLAEAADRRVDGFSKGMKQKLALARALLHQPEVLFLDEPTSGLDPAASRAVVELVLRMAHDERRAVLYCTHRLMEAEAICDRVAILARGRLVAIGTPAELAARLAPARPPVEIEVAGEDVERLLLLVGALDGASAAPSREGAVVVEGVAREDVPALLARVVGAGLRVFRVEPRRARLEDAYFALQQADAPGDEEEAA